MRRLVLGLTVALAGCGVLRDAFSAHPDVAAMAAGQTLTVERLADLAGGAKKVPLRAEALTSFASVYLDYAIIAVEFARGRALDDSALVLAANWPGVAQRRWERFHDQMVSARTTLTPEQTDSAYRAGEVRLFQHILIRVPESAAATVEQQKEQQVQGLLRRVQGGASFAQLARQHSDDPGSKTRGGYLSPVGRGRFVPAFDTVAWALAPGALSGVVRSPFGFHIIRRPPLEEVRDSFRVELESTLAARFDSAYIDSVAAERHLAVVSGGPALVRQVVPQIVAASSDDRKLATYRGGAFRVRDLARWLFAIDPREINGITMATDGQLTQFVRRLAERDLVLLQVDSAGVSLSPEQWREIKTEHDSVLSVLRNVLGIPPRLFTDSAATEQEHVQLAMARVNDYMDRVFKQGTAQFLPVPPFLALALRPRAAWSINEAGVARAFERAQAIRAQVDSAARGSGTGLKPASGPAPVPPDTSKQERR
jgi:PPIC-type peptidyl-prolyl cis-trans isomerase-like protein